MPYPPDVPRRGEVYFANLDPVEGSEQGGDRPVVVVSLDSANRGLPVVVVAAITRTIRNRTSVVAPILPPGSPLPDESAVLTFQIRTLDYRRRLRRYVGALTPQQMAAVSRGLAASFGLLGHP